MTSLALRLQVVPGEPVWLDDRDPSDTGGLDRAAAEALFAKGAERLAALQERMFAQRRWAALLVLQGLDASGKDGAIRRLAAGLNPMALHVTAFAAPSALEQAHDFLWRVHQAAPPRRQPCVSSSRGAPSGLEARPRRHRASAVVLASTSPRNSLSRVHETAIAPSKQEYPASPLMARGPARRNALNSASG